MKIHSKKTDYFKFLFPLSLIIVVVLFSIQLTYDTSTDSGKKSAVEKATILFHSSSIEEMITKGVNQIHRDSICTMFINNQLGTPYLFYVYKDSLSPELMSDRTYLHLHLKDNTAWQKVDKSKFINLDFTRKLKEIQINDNRYYLQQAPLVHDYLELDNIDHINTGRYKYLRGQSYSVRDIMVKDISPVEISPGFKKMVISIEDKAFEKIKAKRAEAMENGVLTSDDTDLVKARISTEERKNLKALIRLKGDWTDHLRDTLKWSYKMRLESDKTLFGMRKFSVQHPIVRGYAWEWLYQKTIKEHGLLGLRYDFLSVEMQVEKNDSIIIKPIGIMALEESIDKILIENNQRREGLIFSFDETLLWDDRKRQRDLQLPERALEEEVRSVAAATIRVFNENRVLATPGLKKQFDTAKNMLQGLRTGRFKISEVFDVDKLTFYVALSNLFGGHHGLIWHNLRIYYNPVTNKLEPVASDSNSGYKIEKVRQYIFSSDDPVYQEKLVEKLKLVSSEEFVQNLYDNNFDELNSLMLNLKMEFRINFDHSVLEHNSNIIKKEIYPANGIIANLVDQDVKEIVLKIKNISSFPVAVDNIQMETGKLLSRAGNKNIVWPGKSARVVLPLKSAFLNAFVSKKNKRGEFRYPKDLSKIRLSYNIPGSNYQRLSPIIPYLQEEEGFETTYRENLEFNYRSASFIEKNEASKTLLFKSGDHHLKESLRLPPGYQVIVEKGFRLNLTNNSSLISYSPIDARATKDEPITFYSSDGSGGGVFITNTSQKSILDHCVFSNLSIPQNELWSLTGAVNFNEADVDIFNSVFEKNRSEDGLNIFRSDFILEGVSFKDTQSDAFDGDFVTGVIRNTTFANCGNDGIDVSGSNLEIIDVELINSGDKAISIGEGSTLKGKDVNIIGGEIGVVSKDLSFVNLNNVRIENSRLAISCFQKKSEYGPGKITAQQLVLLNNELDYLIEEHSELTIDAVAVETKSSKVLELMYGNEYGKSSR